MCAYVYVLRCKDDSLYTGWTNDLAHRLAMHRSGKGAKYTRGRGPLVLVYAEELTSQHEAMQREAAIKALPRKEKLELISSWQCPAKWQALVQPLADTAK